MYIWPFRWIVKRSPWIFSMLGADTYGWFQAIVYRHNQLHYMEDQDFLSFHKISNSDGGSLLLAPSTPYKDRN